MKRLMIYTKYRKINIYSLFEKIKCSSSLILICSLYLCGLIFGSFTTLNSVTVPGAAYNINVLFFIQIIIPLILFIIDFASGFSCLGIPMAGCTPILFGILFGLNSVTQLIFTGINGYTDFLFNNLIANVLISISVIMMSEESLHLSAEISGIIILKRDNVTDVKKYLVKSIIFSILFLCGLTIKFFHLKN